MATSVDHSRRWSENQSCCKESEGIPAQAASSAVESSGLTLVARLIAVASSRAWDLTQDRQPEAAFHLPDLENLPRPQIREGGGKRPERQCREQPCRQDQADLRFHRTPGKGRRADDTVAVLERRPGRIELDLRAFDPLHEHVVLFHREP